jgi:hypothetical protein
VRMPRFQQNGVTARTSATLFVLKLRVTSFAYLSHSPNLAAPGISLWALLEKKIFRGVTEKSLGAHGSVVG